MTERERRIGIGLLAGAIVGGALFVALPLIVGPRADRAVDGDSVGPIRALGFTLLDVSARRARLEPAGDAPKAPAITALSRRPLLYLGQAAGTLVLFDHGADHAVYVPSSSVVVRIEP